MNKLMNDVRCEQIQTSLTALLDGELSSKERRTVDEHVSGCRECRTTLASLENLVGSVRSVARPDVPEGLRSSVLQSLRDGANPGTWVEGPDVSVAASAADFEVLPGTGSSSSSSPSSPSSFSSPRETGSSRDQRVWGLPLKVGIAAAGLFAAASIFQWFPWSEERPSSDSSKGSVASTDRSEPEEMQPIPVAPVVENVSGSSGTSLEAVPEGTMQPRGTFRQAATSGDGSGLTESWVTRTGQVQVVWIQCEGEAQVSDLPRALGLGAEFEVLGAEVRESLGRQVGASFGGMVLTFSERMRLKQVEEILARVRRTSTLTEKGCAPVGSRVLAQSGVASDLTKSDEADRELRGEEEVPVLFLIEIL